MGEENTKVLALYDFASKQQFIYRTSKIKEISGASQLLEGMYRRFPKWLAEEGITLKYDLQEAFEVESMDTDGVVLYDGGGNLMVLYKDEDTCIACNQIISRHILTEFPTLGLIAAHVPYTGNFSKDKKALYRQNRLRKSRFPAATVSAVTPFTQIDATTFLPVTAKETVEGEQLSLSADRAKKRQVYYARKQVAVDEFEGLSAVIYIDGNNMGAKLAAVDAEDYNEGVANLRAFSKEVNRNFVERPLAAFDAFFAAHSQFKGYRKVIGGGDEITIICEAKAAFELMLCYFDCLEASNEEKRENVEPGEAVVENSACAGIAIMHAKSPFTVAYDIAEAACESAKKKAHTTPGNYFDCYYCHAGVTADFDTLRKAEQENTGLPYAVTPAQRERFEEMADKLNDAGRANVKALGAAAQKGKTAYSFEVKRVNAYLKDDAFLDPAGAADKATALEEMQLVYDMAEYFDIWFDKQSAEKKGGRA